MRVVKPLKLGVMPRPYFFAGKSFLCATTFVFFRLGVDDPDGQIIPEHAAWPSIHAALPVQTPLDFGVHKRRGEVLLAGKAFTPGGVPREQITVRLELGSVDKHLLVRGDRHWQYGLVPLYQETAPQPFASMPLTFDRAFGGEGYEPNPIGKGYYERNLLAHGADNLGPLPNVQYLRERLEPGASVPRPASFLPEQLGSADRMKRAGTYDRRWLQRDFPGFARDVDWDIFNVAPTDQRLLPRPSGYPFFGGGEMYRLENLHPSLPVLSGTLPRIRARTFLRTDQTSFLEVPNQADTLWLFPEHALGVMILHATAEVADNEALDVQALMVAYETLSSRPRPDSHYQSVMDLRLDRSTAPKHAFHESQLCPPRPPPTGPTGSEEKVASTQAAIDEGVEDFYARHGRNLPRGFSPPKAKPPPFPVPSRAELQSGDFDLTAMLDGARDATRRLEERARAKLTALTEAAPMAAQRPIDVSLEVEHALTRATGAPSEGLQKLAMLCHRLDSDRTDEINQLAQLQRQHEGRAPKPPPPAAASEIGTALAQYVTGCIREKRSLKDAVLTGVHLQDIDLSDCDLEGVVLAHASLLRVKLDGARLQGASFVGSSLKDVTFRGAQLDGALFNKGSLRDLDFAGAVMNRTEWTEASLEACSFADARIHGAVFAQCALTRCNFQSAEFEKGAWVKAEASRCDFSGAILVQVSFLECQLPGSVFCNARLQKVPWLAVSAPGTVFDRARLAKLLAGGGSVLAGASFLGTELSECGFRGSDLKGVTFEGATLSACDLAQTALEGSCFDGALVSRCVLRETRAQKAAFRSTDLYKSVLTKGNFDGADFTHASLMGVEASGASWRDAQLEHAAPKPETRV